MTRSILTSVLLQRSLGRCEVHIPNAAFPMDSDPWEVFVVARLFFFPGVAILFQRGTLVAFQQSFRYPPSGIMVLSEHGGHIFGALAIAVGLVLVWFYFYLRSDRPR
jgi:hypothetical protein